MEVPWASITDPKDRQEEGQDQAHGDRPVEPLWQPDHGPGLVPQSASLLPAGRRIVGRAGSFQLCRSICGGDEPDPRFEQIKYAVYSARRFRPCSAPGEVKNTNMVRPSTSLPSSTGFGPVEDLGARLPLLRPGSTFADELKFLSSAIDNGRPAATCTGKRSCPPTSAKRTFGSPSSLTPSWSAGGEGVVVRNPTSTWTPRRHKGILKWKPYEDAEGTITGFTSGRETAKGSRLLGKIGALIVDYEGKRLELSGLKDEEREFETAEMAAGPGRIPASTCLPTSAARLQVRQTVTFKYRELSDDGIPKEAHYWRKRDVE